MGALPEARSSVPAPLLRAVAGLVAGLILSASGCHEPDSVAPPPLNREDIPPAFTLEAERFSFLTGGVNVNYAGERILDFATTGLLTEFSLTGYHAGTVTLDLKDTTGALVERFVCSSETSLTVRRNTGLPLRTAAVTVAGFTGVAALSVRSRARYVLLSMADFPTEPHNRWVYLRTRTGRPPDSVEVVSTPPSITYGERSAWTVRRLTGGDPTPIGSFRVHALSRFVWFEPQNGSIRMNEPEPWLPYSRILFPLEHGARWQPISITRYTESGDADALLDQPVSFLLGSFPDVFRVTNRVRLSTASLLETTLWIVPGLGIVRINASTDNPAHPVEEWILIQRRSPSMVWP